MKIKINKPRLFLIALSVICLSAALTSCNKPSGSSNVSAGAAVKIVNAVNGSASQDLYINNNRIDASAVAYGQSSGYYTVTSGVYPAKFTDANSATANASFSVSLAPGNYYSVYYATNDTTKTEVVAQNDQTAPSSGMAKVRFINLSSAISSGIDFGVSGSTKLATSLAYKAVSAYNQIAANTTFFLYASGSVTSSLTIPTTIQAGKIYTIYVTGATTLNLNFFVVAEN